MYSTSRTAHDKKTCFVQRRFRCCLCFFAQCDRSGDYRYYLWQFKSANSFYPKLLSSFASASLLLVSSLFLRWWWWRIGSLASRRRPRRIRGLLDKKSSEAEINKRTHRDKYLKEGAHPK